MGRDDNNSSSLLPALDEDAQEERDFVPSAGNVSVAKPKGNDFKLSITSQSYDRTGKGYLDETEKKLRALDTDNKGELDLDKVYYIMNNLEKQQEKTASLRNMVIVLSLFAVVLALSNIGTSFAAARLAKDTQVEHPDDTQMVNLVDTDSNTIIGTGHFERIQASKSVDGSGRFLQDDLTSEQMYFSDVLTLTETLCVGYNTDNWNGNCEGTAGSKILSKCGYQTSFKMQCNPIIEEGDGSWTFKFQASRGYYEYGEVVVNCPADSTSETVCSVTGFSCGEYCTHGANKYVCDHDTDIGKEFCSCYGCSTVDEDITQCAFTAPPTAVCCEEGDCCPSSAPSPVPTPVPTVEPSLSPTLVPTEDKGTEAPTTCDLPKEDQVCKGGTLPGCCCPGFTCVKRAPWVNRAKCHKCVDGDLCGPEQQTCTYFPTTSPTQEPTDGFNQQGGVPTKSPVVSTPAPTYDPECPNRKLGYLFCGDHASCFRTWQADGILNNDKNQNKNGWVISMLSDNLKCGFYEQFEAVGDYIQACLPSNMDPTLMPKLADVIFNALSGNMTVDARATPFNIKELRLQVYEIDDSQGMPGAVQPPKINGVTQDYGPEFDSVINLANGTQVYTWSTNGPIPTDKWFGIFYGVLCDD